MKPGRGGIIELLVPLRRWLQRRRDLPDRRRVILHIGAHKTGSTSLQYLLEANHLRLPRRYDLVRRTEEPLLRLKRITYGLKTPEAAIRSGPALVEAARLLAVSTPWAAVTLISHEDLLGHMPTRGGVKGLYPFAPVALGAIAEGFAKAGVALDVVIYVRDWDDWRASVFLHNSDGAAADRYKPAYQKKAHGLPDGWEQLLLRLGRVCGDAVPFHVIRFEDDRAAGLMGLGYLRAAGLTPRQIARLRRVPPRNVTRPETVHANPAAQAAKG